MLAFKFPFLYYFIVLSKSFSSLCINWCVYDILVQDCLKSMVGKVDIRIDEGGNVDAGDVLVDTEGDGLEDIQIKTPSKEVRNMAGENDITIDRGAWICWLRR